MVILKTRNAPLVLAALALVGAAACAVGSNDTGPFTSLEGPGAGGQGDASVATAVDGASSPSSFDVDATAGDGAAPGADAGGDDGSTSDAPASDGGGSDGSADAPIDAPPLAPCAKKSPAQTFGGGMYGCAGTARWADRAKLCGPSCTPCTAAQWAANHGTTAPTHDYWTDDNLGYSGTGPAWCEAVVGGGQGCRGTLDDGGDTYDPMRVCVPKSGGDSKDPEGNWCTWTDCGLNGKQPDEYFGGCIDDQTAGTLCCCP
jgi:hypothetical protein